MWYPDDQHMKTDTAFFVDLKYRMTTGFAQHSQIRRELFKVKNGENRRESKITRVN
jgi:hypothetical protein